MKILIVSATKNEVNPLVEELYFSVEKSPVLKQYTWNNKIIDVLITRIGICATTFWLTKTLRKENYDLVINAGIAGSYSKNFTIGNVVNVYKDEFSDLGINDNGKFKTLFDENILNKNIFPFTLGKIFNDYAKSDENIFKLPIANSITVNTVNGEAINIESVRKKFCPDIESMEGAAFFYVCKTEKVKFFQIRAISNFVEPRNKKNWNVALAIEKLNQELINSLSLI